MKRKIIIILIILFGLALPLAVQASNMERIDAFLRERGFPDDVIESMPSNQKLFVYEEIRNDPDATFATFEQQSFYFGARISIFRRIFNIAMIIVAAFLFFGLVIFIDSKRKRK